MSASLMSLKFERITSEALVPRRMTDPAWNDDLLRDPHHVADKRTRVQTMFAAIAHRYDLNNRLHSFGMDQRWRRKASRLSDLTPDDQVVDVACGTGDLTNCFAAGICLLNANRRTTPRATQVVGIDFTFEMLPRAVTKLERFKEEVEPQDESQQNLLNGVVTFANADATALPLPDAFADVVSIAFGIRNVQEPAKALAEFHRVLKPGGRVIILEFSQPRNRLIRFFNDLYCNRIMPTTATWISGDKSGAYKYLPMSVKTFVTREGMMAMMRDAGFVEVTQHPMTFGVAVAYRGYRR